MFQKFHLLRFYVCLKSQCLADKTTKLGDFTTANVPNFYIYSKDKMQLYIYMSSLALKT